MPKGIENTDRLIRKEIMAKILAKQKADENPKTARPLVLVQFLDASRDEEAAIAADHVEDGFSYLMNELTAHRVAAYLREVTPEQLAYIAAGPKLLAAVDNALDSGQHECNCSAGGCEGTCTRTLLEDALETFNQALRRAEGERELSRV